MFFTDIRRLVVAILNRLYVSYRNLVNIPTAHRRQTRPADHSPAISKVAAPDGNPTSDEFREFLGRVDSELLARYADEALIGRFEGSGLALQDIVNEIGRRLSFRVINGRYRGVSGQIGFDGLWRSGESLAIVVEVKTTDAYRIDLDVPAGYRKDLIRDGKITEERSSILIVVGRQDTGDLEAQIRGSRHAWDIRLISVDALLRLLTVRESVDDPSIANKISQILIPREYTRVDSIIDVVFSAAEETLRTGSVVNPDDEDADEEVVPKQKKFVPANFHALCIERIEKALGRFLVRQSPSIYKSSDGSLAVVCSISREYLKSSGAGYWFRVPPLLQRYFGTRHHIERSIWVWISQRYSYGAVQRLSPVA